MTETTNVLFEVWRLARRTGSLLDAELADSGLTAGDYGLYSAIQLWAPTTPSELSRRSGMPLTTVSEALRRLERRGHLERRENPEDARSTTVALNETGLAVHGAAHVAFESLLGRLGQILGRELETIRLALVSLNGALARLAGEPVKVISAEPAVVSYRSLDYHGPPLTEAEVEEARLFLDWLRNRRTTEER